MNCPINLITYKKSSLATNIAHKFDFIIEQKSKVKHLSLIMGTFWKLCKIK